MVKMHGKRHENRHDQAARNDMCRFRPMGTMRGPLCHLDGISEPTITRNGVFDYYAKDFRPRSGAKTASDLSLRHLYVALVIFVKNHFAVYHHGHDTLKSSKRWNRRGKDVHNDPTKEMSGLLWSNFGCWRATDPSLYMSHVDICHNIAVSTYPPWHRHETPFRPQRTI